jgi:hypothetical protein
LRRILAHALKQAFVLLRVTYNDTRAAAFHRSGGMGSISLGAKRPCRFSVCRPCKRRDCSWRTHT